MRADHPTARIRAFCVAPLLAAAALAQSQAVLGGRNTAFLEGLWRGGYVEFADRLGQLAAASNLPADEKQTVAAAHIRLRIAMLAQSGDAVQRRDLVLQVIAEKTRHLAAAPAGSDVAIDLTSELVDQYRVLADALVQALGQESDPEKQAAMRREADEQFAAAVKDMRERRSAVEQLRKEDTPGSEVPFLVASYGLGRLVYYHALIFPLDSHTSKRLAEEALDLLNEFDLEFGDSLAAFEAKLVAALCHQRLGDTALAIGTCDEAIALRERFDRGKDGAFDVDRNAADVIAAAVLQKAMLHAEQREYEKVVEVARDYVATIPRALEAMQGPAVLAAEAEAHAELGDNEAAAATAQKLIELDPRGRWGYRGQEILGRLITAGNGRGVDAAKTLRIAESLAAQGDYDQALRLCRETLLRARSAADEAIAAEALLIGGAVHATRGNLHEAGVAFDAVVRRYPKTQVAPDALWRAIQCYGDLHETDGLALYRRLVDERSRQLVRDYPDDPHVGQLQLLEAQRLERASKFLEAAAVFERVPPDSSVHLEARYAAANCYQRHANGLDGASQAAAIVQFSDRALDGLRAVLAQAEAASLAAADPKVKARAEHVAFQSRVGIANVLLGGARPTEADAVLASLSLMADDKRAPVVWALRIRSKLAQGNVEEAVDDMDAALAKAGSSRPLLLACRTVATALDGRAVERDGVGEHQGARNLWQKATAYYVRGTAEASNAEIAQIAARLLAIGLIVNGVAADVEASYEVPDLRLGVAEPWQRALDLYQRLADADALTWKARIGRARILGFQRRLTEAERDLAQVFAENRLAGADRRLDSAVLARRPELLPAYLEWGFALRAPTDGAEDKARRARASEVFDRVCLSVPVDSKYWWHARHGQIQTLLDRGLYDEADVSLRSLERTNPGFDADRFRLQLRFEALRASIARRIPKPK